MLWRRKSKQFTARVNTVVETAEQVRQSFRPKQPRVEIDMSYVEARSAAAGSAAAATHSTDPTRHANGDLPSYEDALTELASLRELAEVFESEFDKEQTARAAVEAERDEALKQAAETARELEAARASVEAERDEALKQAAETARELEAARASHAARAEAPPVPDDSKLRSLIEALQNQIQHEQDGRRAVLTELEDARQQVREAQSEAAAHREAAIKAAAQSAVAMPTVAAVGSTNEQIEILRADFQAELAAEQSLRRASEAQRDLAERRVAAGNRELEALRAVAAQAKASPSLEAELASAQAARTALARELDEAKARVAALERASATRNAADAEALAAALRDAEVQRDLAGTAKAELAAQAAARLALDQQLQSAQQRIAEMERAAANQTNSDAEALAAALRDAEAQRDLARAAKDELAAETSARAALADKLDQATQQISGLEQALAARDAAGGETLDAANQEIEACKAQIASMTSSLAAEQAAAAAARTAADIAEQRANELQRALTAHETTGSQALAALKHEAEAHRALAEQIESELAAEQETLSATAAELEQAHQLIADLENQLASGATGAAASSDASGEAETLRARTAELEAALAAEISSRGGMEAEMTQASFRLSEMHGQLAAQSEAIEDLEAQLEAAAANAGDQHADSGAADAEQRIAALEREMETLRDTSSRAIDTAMQEAATQRVLAVQLAAELKGERAALDGLAEQLAEAKLRLSELHRDRESRPADINPLSSLINAVGAIPPKAVVKPALPALIQPPSKVPPTARIDTLPLPVVAADEAPSIDGPAGPLLARAQSLLKPSAKPGSTAGGPESRRERRTPAQSPATVWRDGMSQALNCMIRNRSSGGALLEFPADRHGVGITDFSVGDELTLTFTSYLERSSVTCVVARIDGRLCGVKFAGQFHVQMLRSIKQKKPVGKPVLAKPGLGKPGLAKPALAKVGR